MEPILPREVLGPIPAVTAGSRPWGGATDIGILDPVDLFHDFLESLRDPLMILGSLQGEKPDLRLQSIEPIAVG